MISARGRLRASDPARSPSTRHGTRASPDRHRPRLALTNSPTELVGLLEWLPIRALGRTESQVEEPEIQLDLSPQVLAEQWVESPCRKGPREWGPTRVVDLDDSTMAEAADDAALVEEAQCQLLLLLFRDGDERLQDLDGDGMVDVGSRRR